MRHISKIVAAQMKVDADLKVEAVKAAGKSGKWQTLDKESPLTRVFLRKAENAGAEKVRVVGGGKTKDFTIEALLDLE